MKKKPKLPNFDHMANMLQEHFRSYVLVGYTLDGHRAKLYHFPDGEAEDACQQSLADEAIRMCLPEPVQICEEESDHW